MRRVMPNRGWHGNFFGVPLVLDLFITFHNPWLGRGHII